jgi:ABC-2 type transport system ATP-binding protein
MRQRFGVAVALLGNPKLMIVGEPTAGLDPAERVRFLNLLSKLGENSVFLLSTHIVEEVSELCTKMAVIDEGEILLEAEPLRAVDDLHGRIRCRVISKEEFPELEREHAVISTKLLAGRTVMHVYICRIGVAVSVCCAGATCRGRRTGGLTRSHIRKNQA